MRNLHSERGAIFVIFSFLLIVILFAGAGVLSLGYLRYEREAIEDIGHVAAVGSIYSVAASPTNPTNFAYAKQVAESLIESNRQATQLGRFAKDGLIVSGVSVTPGLWDFANAPNCNSGATAPGGCYIDGVAPAAANAIKLSFHAESGADILFGGLYNTGRIGRDYTVYAAYAPTIGPVVIKP